MPIIKLSRKEQRRLTMFMSSLLVAIAAWLFFALSGKYQYQIKARMRYVRPPQSKAFFPLQQDTLRLTVEGSGWQLLFSKLPVSMGHLNVALDSLNQHSFVVLSQQLPALARQVKSQKLVSASPDTLFFDFKPRTVKKVPVKLLASIEYKKQYDLAGPVKVDPEYVTVSGPTDDLKSIKFWESDSLIKTDVASDINVTVALKPSPRANINVIPSVVNVYYPVQEFTETSIELPLKLLNNHRYEVKLLPEKVTVTVLTSLQGYSSLNKESFQAVVDLDNWARRSYSQLPVQITKFPGFCKLVKVEPQAVDFIVKE